MCLEKASGESRCAESSAWEWMIIINMIYSIWFQGLSVGRYKFHTTYNLTDLERKSKIFYTVSMFSTNNGHSDHFRLFITSVE